jgi:hypothetical protein
MDCFLVRGVTRRWAFIRANSRQDSSAPGFRPSEVQLNDMNLAWIDRVPNGSEALNRLIHRKPSIRDSPLEEYRPHGPWVFSQT